MNSIKTIVDLIKQQKMLPLFYHSDATVCLGVVKALYASGVRILEFTNRGEFALENFKAIVVERNKSMKDLLLAVGTIRSVEEVNAFVEVGADFLVSPIFDSAIHNTTLRLNKIWIPGCMTPTEIHTAEVAGCSLIKLFPGHLLGPAFVNAIRDLFPKVDFVVTGGVEANKDNLESWFKSGVCALGMGSKLMRQNLMASKDYSTIETESRKTLELIQSITK